MILVYNRMRSIPPLKGAARHNPYLPLSPSLFRPSQFIFDAKRNPEGGPRTRYLVPESGTSKIEDDIHDVSGKATQQVRHFRSPACSHAIGRLAMQHVLSASDEPKDVPHVVEVLGEGSCVANGRLQAIRYRVKPAVVGSVKGVVQDWAAVNLTGLSDLQLGGRCWGAYHCLDCMRVRLARTDMDSGDVDARL